MSWEALVVLAQALGFGEGDTERVRLVAPNICEREIALATIDCTRTK